MKNYKVYEFKSFTSNYIIYNINDKFTECSCKSYEFCKLDEKTCKHLQYFKQNKNSNLLKIVDQHKTIKFMILCILLWLIIILIFT
jgi:hypothetical protein